MALTQEHKAIMEQLLSELSSDTLKSYSKKAREQASHAKTFTANRPGPKPKKLKGLITKRESGIKKASGIVSDRMHQEYTAKNAEHLANFHKEVKGALFDHGYQKMGSHEGADTYVKSHGTHVTTMIHDKHPQYPSIQGGDGKSSWSSHNSGHLNYNGNPTPVGGHGVGEYINKIHTNTAQNAQDAIRQHHYRMDPKAN